MSLDPKDLSEYDSAAMYVARRRALNLRHPNVLPNLLSDAVARAIEADPEAFEERVRMSAYADAMNRLNLPEDQ